MSRPKQLQLQLQLHLLLFIALISLLQLLPPSAALPQDIIVDAAQLSLEQTQATAPTSPALNVPSDLSVGLNLVPVSSLIAAAANAEPPAPIQFVRIAMNSGL